MSVTATLAPSSANSLASAAPWPLPAPVMIATFPVSLAMSPPFVLSAGISTPEGRDATHSDVDRDFSEMLARLLVAERVRQISQCEMGVDDGSTVVDLHCTHHVELRLARADHDAVDAQLPAHHHGGGQGAFMACQQPDHGNAGTDAAG